MKQALTDADIDALLVAHGKGDDGFHGFARAVIAAHEAKQQADLFWNDDDPETGYRSIDELLDSVWSDGVLEVGAEFTVQQAVSLPRIKVRVTEIDDESGLEYEIVQPIAQAVQS